MVSMECLWWSRGDSNPGPPACKAGALPAELRPHVSSHCGLCLARIGHLQQVTLHVAAEPRPHVSSHCGLCLARIGHLRQVTLHVATGATAPRFVSLRALRCHSGHPALARVTFGRANRATGPMLLMRGRVFWWAMVDSNHRPRSYQDRALTS